MFDYNDDYYYNDFLTDIKTTIFKNDKEVDNFFLTNFPRVCVNISDGNVFLKKISYHKDPLMVKLGDADKVCFTIRQFDSSGDEKEINKVVKLMDMFIRSKLLSKRCCVYDPLNKYKDVFNFYRPPICLSNKPDNISYVKYRIVYETIKELYFTGYKKYKDENEKMNYMNLFHLWISRLRSKVKYPHIKSKCVFVMSSKEGFGKGTLMTLLREYIFGNYCFSETVGMEKLTQRFNSFSAFKLYIAVDEAPHHSGEYHFDADKMKKFITDKKHTVEYKNKEPFEVDNYCEVDIFTNNIMCVKVKDDDTRYCLTELYEQKRDWRYIINQIFTKENVLHFIHYLLNDDDSNYIEFQGRPNIPTTRIKKKLQDFCRDSVSAFKQEIINGINPVNPSVFLPPFTYNNKVIKYAIPCKTFKVLYKDWCESQGESPKKVKEIKLILKNEYRRNTQMYYYLDE